VNADVGVVGAGPAGLLAANALVRAGVESRVFERLSEDAVRARARAGLIEARTVALLDRYGLANGLHAQGLASGACEFRTSARPTTRTSNRTQAKPGRACAGAGREGPPRPD
jgi:p-hydroxybenzoate 3-monooxygenase